MEKVASEQDPDFIISVGDNLYPETNTYDPELYEIRDALELIQSREKLNSLPIYSVQGNHDFMIKPEKYSYLHKYHANWLDRPKFYEERVCLGGLKYAGFLYIDTTVLLCQYIRWHYNCTAEVKEEARYQEGYINQTLNTWDDSVVWRVVIGHHPFFDKSRVDQPAMINHILPLFRNKRIDLYLCGHEHV